jgi:hypothetical protein
VPSELNADSSAVQDGIHRLNRPPRKIVDGSPKNDGSRMSHIVRSPGRRTRTVGIEFT